MPRHTSARNSRNSIMVHHAKQHHRSNNLHRRHPPRRHHLFLLSTLFYLHLFILISLPVVVSGFNNIKHISSTDARMSRATEQTTSSHELKMTTISGGDCKTSERAKRSDEVHLHQTGIRMDNGAEIDRTGVTPLILDRLGSGHILRGMEIALTGMCQGEILEVEIPPHLHFYEPNRNYLIKIKPAPPNVWVKYRIHLVYIKPRGDSLQYVFTQTLKAFTSPSFLIVFGMISGGILFLLSNTSVSESSGGSGNGSRKKKKKRK